MLKPNYNSTRYAYQSNAQMFKALLISKNVIGGLSQHLGFFWV
jgi:hypothetical protein